MDAFDRITKYAEVIEDSEGLTPHDRSFLHTLGFFCAASNSGRIYPYLDVGLEILPFLMECGLCGTVSVLERLKGVRDAPGSTEAFEGLAEDHLDEYEGDAEGDFEWAVRIESFIQTKPELFSTPLI